VEGLKDVSRSERSKSDALFQSEIPMSKSMVPMQKSETESVIQNLSLEKFETGTNQDIEENKNLETDESNLPLTLDGFFEKLIEINKQAHKISEWDQFVVNNYSRPNGFLHGEKALIQSQSEAFFDGRYR